MKTFDDFAAVELMALPGAEKDEEKGRPKDGKMITYTALGGDEGTQKIKRRVIRSKAISAMALTSLIISNPQEEVATNLVFRRHHSRPFVMWLAEVE